MTNRIIGILASAWPAASVPGPSRVLISILGEETGNRAAGTVTATS